MKIGETEKNADETAWKDSETKGLFELITDSSIVYFQTALNIAKPVDLNGAVVSAWLTTLYDSYADVLIEKGNIPFHFLN
jgi:hypothetical protein